MRDPIGLRTHPLSQPLGREAIDEIPRLSSRRTSASRRASHLFRLVGLVTHRGLVRDPQIEGYERPVGVEQERLEALPISSFTKKLVETVSPNTPIERAGRTMLENLYGALPVVEDERFVGVHTEADFIRFTVTDSRSTAS